MRFIISLELVLITLICLTCTTPHSSRIIDPDAGSIEFRCLPFDLEDVRLLDGPFRDATELNIQSLLNYEPDRFLAKFRKEAGLEPKADHYNGWEDQSIAGHSMGHYLSACAMMYNSTGDNRFADRVNYMVSELAECQKATGNGYFGAIPGGQRILEEEVSRGIIKAEPFNLNGIWVPFYSIHKIFAGLRDAYRFCKNEEALEVEQKLADWMVVLLSDLSDDQMQEVLSCEHGGMNEVFADLYSDTGNKEYLDLSLKFHHLDILDPLSRSEDILPGQHGNTQIPKLIGLARRFELTASPSDRETAEFFWDRVVNHHSYVNGSHGNHEHFGPPDQLSDRLSSNSSESCNVYNMLKLSEHLFTWDASPEVADFYERALFNHILSSQHPVDGRVMYFHSLQMGGHKFYQDPYWFTCCVGSGMENHSKYGCAIFYHSMDELFINQFIASELNWEEKGLIVRQVTGFPQEQGTTIEFLNEQPLELTLRIRYPGWAGDDLSILVNGRKIKIKERQGSFIPVRRIWQKGDRVEVKMPFSLRTESMPDDPDRVAICYGPLVLCGDLGPAYDSLSKDPLYVPGLVTEDRDPANWLIPSEEEPNTFVTSTVCKPREVTLKPLYLIHDRTYTVYWDIYAEEEWSVQLENAESFHRETNLIKIRTIDYVIPGSGPESQSHGFEAENPGFFEFNGQNCVESRFSWFSYDMKVDKGKPTGLMVEYWGGFPGPRKFEIKVNGEVIATEDFSGLAYNESKELLYTIPVEKTSRGIVTVTFAADKHHFAGPVFGIRTITMN